MITYQLKRFANGKDSTLGALFLDGVFQCFILEDEFREEKVAAETRIPMGRYEIKFREVPSPTTQRYRQKYDWFNWHLELQDVPNFKYVYIHVGNTDDDSAGCLLTGAGGLETVNGEYRTTESVRSFKRLYEAIRMQLKVERVFIEIQPGF